MCDFKFIEQPGCSCVLAGDINQIAVHLIAGLGTIKKSSAWKYLKHQSQKHVDHDGWMYRQEESSSAPQHILKTFKQDKFNLGERESDWRKNTLIVKKCICKRGKFVALLIWKIPEADGTRARW